MNLFYTIIIVLVSLNTPPKSLNTKYKHFKYTLSANFTMPEIDQLNKEVEEIIGLQRELTATEYQKIQFWNSAYPSYRWHQEMMKASDKHKGHKNGARVVILHLAIYDAMVEVWKSKHKTLQKAPFQADSSIEKLSRARDYSSFICEYSGAAGAAQTIISYYFPDQKSQIDSLVKEFKIARLRSGLQYPSDIELGLKIGRQIAQKYIEYAKTDLTDQEWTGKAPISKNLWKGNPGKWDPMKGQWKPLTLEKPNQFRPGPPPTDWSEDMAELHEFNATNQGSDIAWKWKSEPVWDKLLEEQILAYDLAPLEAAYSSALFHTARYDATIAAWEAKYYYWGIRPFQYDTTFKPILVETPNFPGYPAGHSTVAGSLATVLIYLFPRDKELFQFLAIECAESRFEGGVHFRTDDEVGLEVGEKVGEQVLKVFTQLSP